MNGETIQTAKYEPPSTVTPNDAAWLDVIRTWAENDLLTLDFDLPVRVLRAHKQVRSVRGKAALARGPLVYCLESVDHPEVDISTTRVDTNSLFVEPADILGGIMLIKGCSLEGIPLIFIPYYLWGNRGPSRMSVFVYLSS